jgi:AraC family transcriptional regulator, activator of mtrCDE
MDLLSRLLTLMPVTGTLDFRCHFGVPWRLYHGTSGGREIPYHVLLRGSAVVEDGLGPPLHMNAGDIVLFPSGVAHVLHDGRGELPVEATRTRLSELVVITNNGEGDPADLLCGRFVIPAVPQQLLKDHLPCRMLVHSKNSSNDASHSQNAAEGDSRLARLIGLMREESLEREAGSEALVNHLSSALFGMTLRFADDTDESARGVLALAKRPRLQAALTAMFDEPGKSWSQPDLAALCNMSRATFSRHFEDAIGRSANDFLIEIRMAVAGRKLVETDISITEIGEEVGYQSVAAFQRAFKKRVGVTPAQWRVEARTASSSNVR